MRLGVFALLLFCQLSCECQIQSGTVYRRRDVDTPQEAPYSVSTSGAAKISSFTPTTPFHTFGMVKSTYDGKYYFGLMGRIDKNRDPYIYRYNAATNRIEQEQRISIGVVPNVGDSHRIPDLEVDPSTGHIYVVCEKLSATVQSHGTDILIYKTTVPGDLSTLTLLQTLTGSFTYPLIRISGSNVYVSARGHNVQNVFIRGEQYYYNSTNSGASFGAGVKVYDSGDEDKVSYMHQIMGHDGSIYMVLNERDNVLENWTFVAVFKGSFNSNVWTNIDGTFSKNVSTSGAITRAEMVANCIVYNSPDYNNVAVNFEGGIVKSDGSIKLVISTSTLTGNSYLGNPESELDELRFYYRSGGAWAYNVMDSPTGMVYYWAYQRYFLYQNNNESFDDFLLIDPTNSNNLYLKRSNDNFATETSTLVQAGNSNYRFGQTAFNVESEDDYCILLIDSQGDYFGTSSTETNADYSNFLVVRP
jgi:hypothetical protein